MDLKFVRVLDNFFPKGKFWESQTNIKKVINGVSDEFARIHKESKTFYNNFNIINSTTLAKEHSQDYLIIQDK